MEAILIFTMLLIKLYPEMCMLNLIMSLINYKTGYLEISLQIMLNLDSLNSKLLNFHNFGTKPTLQSTGRNSKSLKLEHLWRNMDCSLPRCRKIRDKKHLRNWKRLIMILNYPIRMKPMKATNTCYNFFNYLYFIQSSSPICSKNFVKNLYIYKNIV